MPQLIDFDPSLPCTHSAHFAPVGTAVKERSWIAVWPFPPWRGGHALHLLVPFAMPSPHTPPTLATVFAEIAIVWNDCE